MKSLAVLLSFVALTTTAFASSGFNVKVSDGGTAHCKTKADAFRNKFGAYQPRLKSIAVDRDMAKVKLEVSFLSCIEKDGAFGFSAVSAYDSVSYQSITFNNGNQTVTAKTELVKMLAFKDGVYKKIADVTLEDKQKQIVTLNIKIDDLLSAEEQESLEEGKVVLGNFDYALQKFIKIEGEKNVRAINYGAFRIHFKAVLDSSYSLKIIGL